MNSKKLEKSRGILAFAYNVDTIDYISIARKTLELASKNLNLPYTLITDTELKNNTHNTRYDIDSDSFIAWRNIGRHHAYELSPYEETLVIDVDYLILDDQLNNIFNLNWDYILQRNSYALTDTWPKLMGNTSLPYIWATVFAFRKTPKAKMYFDLVGRIQRNYSYYKELFNIEARNFRNDYAFAIADIILNGYTISQISIPDNMLAINQVINSIELKDNKLVIRDKSRSYVLPKMNLHIMSKGYLQSENFQILVKELINE